MRTRIGAVAVMAALAAVSMVGEATAARGGEGRGWSGEGRSWSGEGRGWRSEGRPWGSGVRWSGGHSGHSHSRVGVYIGGPLYWGWPGSPYYGYAWPAYPVTVPPYGPAYAVPLPPYGYAPYGYGQTYPPVIEYVERDDGVRYYCQDPAGFYPAVTECASGWLKVVREDRARRQPPAPASQSDTRRAPPQ